MLRTSMLTIAVVFAAGPAARAQLPPQPPPPSVSIPLLQQGNDEERAACHPDVIRFCRSTVDANPDDVFGILGCLQSNRTRISRACATVLANHGQ